MSWQKDLRSLDAELAEKRITPAEYRSRRDDLLASVSGGMPPTSPGLPFPQHVEPSVNGAEMWTAVTPMPTGSPQEYGPPPELFNTRMTRRTNRKHAVTVTVVVVLLVVGLGVGWWFGFRVPTTTSAGGQPAASGGAAVTAVQLSDLPPLPGKADANNGDYTVDQAAAKGLIEARARTLLAGDQAGKVVFSGSTMGDLTYVVYVINTDTAEQAAKIAADLVAYQKANALTPTDKPGLPPSVSTLQLMTANLAQCVAIYPSTHAVVIASASQRTGQLSEATITAGIRDVMAVVMARVPLS
ncbi:hypothetical protein [Kutzneria buriramensis]|uniref:Uncharacterized protein n=1 Tax=Kutzneria buriramensis TaxID=1045776 RepID=A0A3E0HUJ2_9PSEU|nr:hypothetical protein [Kutzneria buriramensis]REH50071.1 hypothetical protein BCF44_104341 [Kutzneria buriramensis]